MTTRELRKRLLVDFAIITIAFVVAALLVRTGALHALLGLTKGFAALEVFFSGAFFTSAFTTPFSIAVFLEMGADGVPLVPTALLAAVGAVCGDYILFRFVRDRFGEDVLAAFRKAGKGRFKHFLELRLFRFLTFMVGALIIASPLPDELAIAFLGFSRTRTLPFLCISFTFNFLGVLGMLAVGRGIAVSL
jgi:hypothetical protein